MTGIVGTVGQQRFCAKTNFKIVCDIKLSKICNLGPFCYPVDCQKTFELMQKKINKSESVTLVGCNLNDYILRKRMRASSQLETTTKGNKAISVAGRLPLKAAVSEQYNRTAELTVELNSRTAELTPNGLAAMAIGLVISCFGHLRKLNFPKIDNK